jgi:hypothetical protein
VDSLVDPNEDIASFVLRSDEIVNTNLGAHIRHTRLLPRQNKETGRIETSVCRSSELTEFEIWDICRYHFDTHAPKPAVGVGIGKASVVYQEGLSFDPNGVPYPQHADIVGWAGDPSIPEDERKHFWMAKAKNMATNFRFFLRPSGT